MNKNRIDKRRIEFAKEIFEKWLSPDVDENYSKIPDCPGVYCLLLQRDLKNPNDIPELLYIGSSKCLSHRSGNHSIIRAINESYPSGYLQFFFKATDDFLEEEKRLVIEYKPILNTVRNFK